MMSVWNCSFLKDFVDLVCHWLLNLLICHWFSKPASTFLDLRSGLDVERGPKMVDGWKTKIMIFKRIAGSWLWLWFDYDYDYDLRELLAHFHHLEYIAARKSWMAGSTAEGGQSVIKSVANLTTLNIPLRRCAPTKQFTFLFSNT